MKDISINNEIILTDLLELFGITHLVFTAGAENSLLKAEITKVPRYNTFHAVDERNAAYFALGLSLELHAPVAVVCSTNASATNYLPAIAEAYYQHLPVLFVAENRIGTENVDPLIAPNFKNLTKKAMHIPQITDSVQERKNEVSINMLLQSLTLFGEGPVFISYTAGEDVGCSKNAHHIKCLTEYSGEEVWKNKVKELERAERIAIVVDTDICASMEKALEFSEKFDALIVCDRIPLMNCSNACPLSSLIGNHEKFPDYLITLSEGNGEHIEQLQNICHNQSFKHWHISPAGNYYDKFNELDTVFVASPAEYFDFFIQNIENPKDSKYRLSMAEKNATQDNQFIEKEEIHIFQTLAQTIKSGIIQNSYNCKENWMEHLQWNDNVSTYDTTWTKENVGCISTFLGLTYHAADSCYLIIDDISFYNDMNALMLRGIRNNIHIIMINKKSIENAAYTELGETSTNKSNGLREWAISTGFEYDVAFTEEEAENRISKLPLLKHPLPTILEICLK